jgi:predicted ATP-dependent protease
MKDKRKSKKSLAKKYIEDEDMEEILKQYDVVEKQIEKALVEGIDGTADVRTVQSILLYKIVQVAITIGTPKENFMEKVRLTWGYLERLREEEKEKGHEGVIH